MDRRKTHNLKNHKTLLDDIADFLKTFSSTYVTHIVYKLRTHFIGLTYTSVGVLSNGETIIS